ncbi:protein BREAST CANCER SUSCEPTIBILITY 1 homolog [Oryza brachyantha]|uniref:RING-type E3 ubiquitin transferase BRCA1 n=1 Tax=Oryza brachyantha TaxID=4533 RepID=J3M8S1_ORYBR|nr:protein BREAST CANCER SUSCEPTIBILITY 1 homolog [Oryza brachyantha]
MADVGSLEKMGRELKCPICLSLLSSAVSISCNHIFCNDCLTESMKSASSCPVCKIPFRRREMRPAPHMDNLVSIFKSMEAATGINVVSTQVDPAVKVADRSECVNSGKNSKSSLKPLARKRKVSCKKENNTKKDATASTSCPTTKPSFSTNKRIQVTPFPESETPIRTKKIMNPEELKNNQNDHVEENKSKAVTSDQPESPSLSPFFWLREHEEEVGCTAETLSETLSLDTPLRHDAPSFSDIKDSDDEIPFHTTPNSKPTAKEFFDSEIFEWTQRPCSPELCSTPLKKQSKAKNKLDQIEEKGDEDIHIGGSFDQLGHAQPVNTKATKQKRKKTSASNRKIAKTLNRAERCIKKTDANDQGLSSRRSVSLKSCQKNSVAVGRNTSGRRNKASSNSKPIHCSSDNPPESYFPKEILDVEAPDDPLSERNQDMEKNSRRKGSARKPRMEGKTTEDTTERNCEPRSKRAKRMSDRVIAEPVEVPSGSGNEAEVLQLHTVSKGSIQRTPANVRRKRKVCGEQKSKNELESTISDIGTMTPIVLPGRCQSNEALCTAPSVRNASIKNKQAEFIEPDFFGIENFENLQACPARNVLLKKCEDTSLKVSCAFCQSGVITEDSGEMVHYQNGKQVPAEFNGGVNVVHSHKNCLEWAPDVYFEDESVFNLTTELARSRRIKCACCGIKGAALGCFEMSCRRSFHFTCAKLIPECRWDNENFVMLCPLHRSSKLPNENPEQQKQPKRKITPKGPSQIERNQDCSNNWKWPSGSPQKWVLCCSSLSGIEKEVVSEFAKLAGVHISANWSSNVTHVIASTDLSGACKRTLKFLMAILNGRWIVSIDWVKTCMECMEPIDEQKFEVTTDVQGITDGPRLGRCRVIDRQPKLFDGVRFYLHGDFTKSYRGYLQELVAAAGGTVLQRKPVSRDQQKLLDDSSASAVLIVYSVESKDKPKSKGETEAAAANRRQADAQALAFASGGRVVSSAWVIDSIAACKLQPL